MYQIKDFKGIIPALMTPYDKDGRYDKSCSAEMVDWLVSMGVGGFYLTGSNGTGAYMDSEERIEVVDTITAQVNGRVPVMAHIAAVSSRLSAKMASAAQKSGCTAVSAVPSYYEKLTISQMMEYYTRIADASDLPLIVYAQTHIYEPSVEMFEQLNTIDKVAGVKFTGPNHYMMGRIKEHLGKDFIVFSGFDEMILSGLIYGADAVIGGTYNVMPDLYMRCQDKLFHGDVKGAKKDVLAANAIVELMCKYGIACAMHANFEFMGINAGYNPSPIHNLDQFEKNAYRKELTELKHRLDIEPIAIFDCLE